MAPARGQSPSRTTDPEPGRSAAHLSEAIARGDPAALAEFYESRFDRLYTLARSFTGRDEAFCLDVVQETMLRIARRMRPMATDADVDRWTAAVLRSAATDLIRRDRRRQRRERATDVGSATSVLPRSISTQPREPAIALQAALSSLPPDDALLLRLRFQHGATLDQAGRAVNTTGDAAHGRIRRALRKLRALLSESTP
jgi:RNA polymerase sigma-70 factor (ECF subfamily)